MKIEFFSDKDGSCNVRFPGKPIGSNEVILGIFYDYTSSYSVDELFNDIEKVISGNLKEEDQKNYEFGDFITGELGKKYTILIPDGPITSNSYRIKTLELKAIIQKWYDFDTQQLPNIQKTININAEILK